MQTLNKKPLTIAEASTYADNLEERKPLADYFKKFAKLKPADAKKLLEELKSLNNIKLKESQLIKIVDTLPKDAEELNKVCAEANLSEAEVQSILEKVKAY